MKSLIKLILIPLSIALSVACSSTEQAPEPRVYGSEEFGSYLRLFQTEAEKRGVEVPMPYELKVLFIQDFGKESNIIGLCERKEGKILVFVNKKQWYGSGSLAREMLIFHELGHCLLDYEHDESRDMDGMPSDIMYPAIFDASYYMYDRKKYLDRFFSQNRVSTRSWRVAKSIYKCSMDKKKYK